MPDTPAPAPSAEPAPLPAPAPAASHSTPLGPSVVAGPQGQARPPSTPVRTGTERPVVLISGISGSGKSVALNALEDAGYFCVDNLPTELLRDFIRLQREHGARLIAVAADVRSDSSLPRLLPLLDELRREGTPVLSLFLDSRTETLVRRFSETRRRHPLSLNQGDPGSQPRSALIEAIERERELLVSLREVSTVIDTSDLRPAQLRAWVRQLGGAAHAQLALVFESFAFKHGVPRDADLVFDLRVLPNPHYVRELRALTGRDAGVIDFLSAQPEVTEMLAQIEAFLDRWLPAYEQDQRAYLTVALGCTGGQHRSVYSVEQLAARYRSRMPTLIRHRELEAREER